MNKEKNMNKFLTKSKIKSAYYCPQILKYVDDKSYENAWEKNEFLMALAEGGYQVEYLTKDYYKDGINLSHLSIEENVNMTKYYLNNKKDVVLFEPLFIWNDCLIRIDILEKKGDTLNILEVKAKSFNGSFLNDDGETLIDYSSLINKKFKKYVKIKSDWIEYVFDIVFQDFVLKNIFTKYDINSYLVMMNKNAVATVSGLNQKYRVKNGKIEVKEGEVGDKIMIDIPMNDIISIFKFQFQIEETFLKKYIDNYQDIDEEEYFKKWVELIRNLYFTENSNIKYDISSKCKGCPYFIKDEKNGKSGFLECWNEKTNIPKEELIKNSTVLDIWNYRGKDNLINNDIFMIKDIQYDDIEDFSFENFIKNRFPKEEIGSKLSQGDRQYVQIVSEKINNNDIVVLRDQLKNEIEKWKYPYNFIDFETTAMAIPAFKNLTPYQTIAFQFSHHILHEDGRIEHKSQYLNLNTGEFPSIDFLDNLMFQLEKNEGTIFRYSPHENSILNTIYNNLDTEFASHLNEYEKKRMKNFIKSITYPNDNIAIEEKWEDPKRLMVDLWGVLKNYYYNPLTKGSNSIKDVLPSILNKSEFLQKKYSKPIYGTKEIPSLNFKDKTWIQKDNDNNIINPYKQLPVLFENQDEFSVNPKLANGGEAMIAYAKSQFVDISNEERYSIWKGLLNYCELDTFSMVLIVEHWLNDLNIKKLNS